MMRRTVFKVLVQAMAVPASMEAKVGMASEMAFQVQMAMEVQMKKYGIRAVPTVSPLFITLKHSGKCLNFLPSKRYTVDARGDGTER